MTEKDMDLTKEIPSNEEIIDDLTKDFESKILPANEEIDEIMKDLEEKFPIESEISGNFEEPNTTKEKLDDDSEKEAENKEKVKDPFDDYIDEAKLKEVEQTLSDEEKEKRKIEAETLKQKGNEEFKNSNFFESIQMYTSALRLCPLSCQNERSILFSNRSASKIKLNYNESALEDCTKALELNPAYVKALFRRAKLYETMDKLDESLEDYKKILELDPSNSEVRGIIHSLSIRIDKRNEEMKTEMLGKLKDLGNLILKPFGLSTNNFQLNQDPNSGGYSINFTQNK